MALRSPQSKLFWFGLVALALHLAVLRIVPRSSHRAVTPPPATPVETALEEVSLDPPLDPFLDKADPKVAAMEPAPPTISAAASNLRAPSLGMVDPSQAPSSEPPGASETVSPAQARDAYRFSPFQSTEPTVAQTSSVQGARIVVPGLANAVAVQQASPDATSKDNNVNKMLRDGLAAKDTERAIYRGQLMARAADEAMHGDGAPDAGKARFEITFHRDGGLTARVLSSSNEAEFESARKRLLQIARAKIAAGQVLRLPEGAKGLTVEIDVEAHYQFPNGRRPSEIGELKSKATLGRATEQKDGSIIVTEMPGVSVGVKGKVCDVGVYAGPGGVGIGGGCDPTNIGSPPRRLASARIVKETLL
jgi:hypothetical protein